MAGAGLVEALIALLILAFGVLGIAGMQMASLRDSQSSVERTQATMLTYSILDAMRANRDAAINNQYDSGMLCEAPTGGTLAANDLVRWIGSLQGTLSASACGEVDCQGDQCTITIQWSDARAGGEEQQRMSTRTRL
jgi:type IV pilus assembly protein PilV